MAYAGYSGYDEESVKRQRAIADAMLARSLGNRGPVQHATQGVARLAEAFFAREAMNKADASSDKFTENRKAIADKMLSQAFPGAAQPTETGAAFDLRPAAMEGRQREDDIAAQTRSMADLTGDPLQAMQHGYAMKDRDTAEETRKLEREALMRKLNAPIEVSRGATLADPNTMQPLFTAPDPTAETPGGVVHSVVIDENGMPRAVMRNAEVKELGFQAQDNIGTVDVGGVPYTYSRRGAGGPTPVTTAADVGQNAGTVAAGKELGIAQAASIEKLPESISTANRAIASIDELLNSKGFNDAYGLGRANPLGLLPGSDRKNTEAIRNKLDGQFFISAITSMQVSLTPVSDADALRLVASVSQLSDPDISPEEARRVASELKEYFEAAKLKATEMTRRGPLPPGAAGQFTTGQSAPGQAATGLSPAEASRLAELAREFGGQ